MIRRVIRKVLKNLDLKKCELGKKDREFLSLFNQIEKHAKKSLDRIKLFFVYQLCRHCDALKGEMAEVGVFRGSSSKIILESCPDKKVHLFDTFEGFLKVSKPIDKYNVGDYKGIDVESVKKYLNYKNVNIYQGWFPETAGPIKNKKFCFVHLDGDLYQTTKDGLNFFYKRMVKGGIILFDDYGVKQCPGVKKAVQEFLKGKREKAIEITDYQAILIKI